MALIEAVAVGDEAVEGRPGVDEKAGDLDQLGLAEGPGAEDGKYLEDDLSVEIDFGWSADTDVAGAGKGTQAREGLLPGGGVAGGLEGGGGALAAGEIEDGLHRDRWRQR